MKINQLGMQYYKSAKAAEKLIKQYQEIKMDTEISLQKRKAVHESMVMGL